MARAFTQVVQDSQFSALGIVLVAELARVWKLIGGSVKVVDDSAEVVAVDSEQRLTGKPSQFLEDIGEAVERIPKPGAPSTDVRNESTTVDNAAFQTEPLRYLARPLPNTSTGKIKLKPIFLPKVTIRQKKKPSKARKGSSVIDDLFRGLG